MCRRFGNIDKIGKVAFVSGLLALSSTFSACSGSQPDEEISLRQGALSAPTVPGTFVFIAAGSVATSDRTQVTGGNVGAAAATGDAITAGFDGKVGIGKGLIGRRVVLKDRAAVGDLFATQVVAPAATFASLSPFSAPPAPPPIVAFNAGSTAVTVNGGASQTLAAGDFGQVTVNGTLHLSGGTYQVQNLTLGNDASLIADASSIVRVAGRVVGADRVHINPAAPLGAGALRLVAAGSTDTTGGLTFGNDARITALLLSRVTVRTGDRLIASGAVAAGQIVVGSDARFAFDTGFGCNTDAGCNDGNACTTDRCLDGQCQHPAVTNGIACTDGNACTQLDTCQAGLCVGANPVVCSASNQCHNVGTCNPATGTCSNPTKADGSACTDGNACTQPDSCQAGVCTSGAPVTCDNGLFCDGQESCDPGLGCVAGAAPPVTDGVACTDDTCNESADRIDHAPNNALCGAGFSCDATVGCKDIDECANGTANCSVNATCTNTNGGFTCACKAGFTGNGVTCNQMCTPMIVGAGVQRCVLARPDGTVDLFLSPSDTIPWNHAYLQSDEPDINFCGPTAGKNLLFWYGLDESYSSLGSAMKTNSWNNLGAVIGACNDACPLKDPIFGVCLDPVWLLNCSIFGDIVAEAIGKAGSLPSDVNNTLNARRPPGYVRCNHGGTITLNEIQWSLAHGNPVLFLEAQEENVLHWAVITGIFNGPGGELFLRMANASPDRNFSDFQSDASIEEVSTGFGSSIVKGFLSDVFGLKPSNHRWAKTTDVSAGNACP